jgi:hypothetical protein
LQFTGSGATFTVGQTFTPSDPWPRVTLRRYTVLLDYEHERMWQELVREMRAAMPRGGVPFTGELRQTQLRDARATWDIPGVVDPSAGSLPVTLCTPPEAGGTAPKPAPTPHGFLTAAGAHQATTSLSSEGTIVSFAIDGTHKMTGIIDAHHHVTRVQAWTAQSIIGDMLVDTPHLGGIRTAIDEGATIVTHQSNRAFLERAATAPHTIAPDRLSQSKKALTLETVGAERTLTDGARVITLSTMTPGLVTQ